MAASNAQMGSLDLIMGPMFSGKTTELMRRTRRHGIAGKNCVMIKYSGDTRYTEKSEAVTHDLATWPAMECTSLKEISHQVDAYDVISIDEGQFLSDIVPYCTRWAQQGKVVIVAALDGTFERKPFGEVLSLVPHADNVDKLSAVCACGKDAPFSHRITKETAVEVIGGGDKYVALCRACYDAKQ